MALVANPYHYLSFVDTSRPYKAEEDYPGGPRWSGACYVPGATLEEAVANAWKLGCNPGGQVKGFGPIPGADIALKYRHRLLSREDLDEQGREFGYDGEDLELHPDPASVMQPGNNMEGGQ